MRCRRHAIISSWGSKVRPSPEDVLKNDGGEIQNISLHPLHGAARLLCTALSMHRTRELSSDHSTFLILSTQQTQLSSSHDVAIEGCNRLQYTSAQALTACYSSQVPDFANLIISFTFSRAEWLLKDLTCGVTHTHLCPCLTSRDPPYKGLDEFL